MNLTIANISSKISDQDFGKAVAAIARQVTEHFQPEWGKSAKLKPVKLAIGPGAAPIDGAHGAIIYVGDDSQDPTTGVENALGYHSRNHGKVPYGFVYLDVVEKYGEPWSSTLSHEVLELLEDPTAVKVVTGPAPGHPDISVYYDLEVCDPTQGDLYDIDGVTVSNFVGRAYFGQVGGSGKTNYLDLLLDPFGVRPRGYFQFEYGTHVYQVNGERVTQSMVMARRAMKKVRRNARRAARVQRDADLALNAAATAARTVGTGVTFHLNGTPATNGAGALPIERVQRDGAISVTGTNGPAGSSVSGTVTIHFDRAPIALSSSELS